MSNNESERIREQLSDKNIETVKSGLRRLESSTQRLPDMYAAIPQLKGCKGMMSLHACFDALGWTHSHYIALWCFAELAELGEVWVQQQKTLQLHHWCSYHNIPENLGKLTHLEELHIVGVEEVGDWIAKLQSLKVLNLSQNYLEAVPQCVYKLPNLTTLIIRENDIAELDCIPSLQYL